MAAGRCKRTSITCVIKFVSNKEGQLGHFRPKVSPEVRFFARNRGWFFADFFITEIFENLPKKPAVFFFQGLTLHRFELFLAALRTLAVLKNFDLSGKMEGVKVWFMLN